MSEKLKRLGHLGESDSMGYLDYIRSNRSAVLLQASVPYTEVQNRSQHTFCLHHLLVSHLRNCKPPHIAGHIYHSDREHRER